MLVNIYVDKYFVSQSQVNSIENKRKVQMDGLSTAVINNTISRAVSEH